MSDTEKAKAAFVFVRDEIPHSFDICAEKAARNGVGCASIPHGNLFSESESAGGI